MMMMELKLNTGKAPSTSGSEMRDFDHPKGKMPNSSGDVQDASIPLTRILFWAHYKLPPCN